MHADSFLHTVASPSPSLVTIVRQNDSLGQLVLSVTLQPVLERVDAACEEAPHVLHGESSKRPALPRNTKEREHLQSTQTTTNRYNSQTKNQALSKSQLGRRITPINTAAVHASAQQEPAIITRTQQGHHQVL